MKINIGAGQYPISGVINVDVDPRYPNVVHDSGQHYLSQLSDDSVSTIIMGNLWQMLTEKELHELLMEVVRVIKGTGKVFIGVPEVVRIVQGLDMGMINPEQAQGLVLGIGRYNHHHMSIWTRQRVIDTCLMYGLHHQKDIEKKHMYFPMNAHIFANMYFTKEVKEAKVFTPITH